MTDARLAALLGSLAADRGLWDEFNALCDFGGRLAGSASEAAARDWAVARLAATGGRTWLEHVPYAAWRAGPCSLALADGTPLACQPLLGSAATAAEGLVAEVIDLGRGTPEAFALHASGIPGKAVLVRHEYPFMEGHVHRRRKYDAARAAGAAAFIIANTEPGGSPTSGSSGRAGGDGIPAVATDLPSAARITAQDRPRVRLCVQGEDHAGDAATPMLDLPGTDPDSPLRIVLSAHLDGHPLGESAMDNGSGVAVVLALARAVAPLMPHARHGLRVALFTAEEWALSGSRQWLARMPPAQRDHLLLNLNLDTVGADAQLTALSSGFAGLEPFVTRTTRAIGLPVACYRPLMANSDHANFAAHGIPALRLVAGFDRPASGVRHILTAQDTRDKVAPGELKSAALASAALLWRALNADAAEAAAWRIGTPA
jgi:aminopeptidase YwaD